ncbi:Ribokinase-like protein [Dipodascopsis tothii]|uniref:Ribokinase-like protein n=1 Tax=Dipodascopsis tothii TaxID=44089 RepID=UPI0034CFB011
MPSTKDMLLELRKCIPPLLEKYHKGQAGRIAVVGGSEDYTGAPFFSAQAATLLGADMAHIVCEPSAAQVIKTYSPNLMVHPYMRDSRSYGPSGPTDAEFQTIADKIQQFLDRVHVVVVGPGLGRDVLMQKLAKNVIMAARDKKLHIIIDADGLLLLQNYPEIIKGYPRAVITPNVMEMRRLCAAYGIECPDNLSTNWDYITDIAKNLSKTLGGLTVIAKGRTDVITNGVDTLSGDIRGGLKRVSGQGDTLSGTLATFLAWKNAYDANLWDHDKSLVESKLMLLAAFGASCVTRLCARKAYEKHGRSMLTSNISEQIGDVYRDLFENSQPVF